MTRSETTSKDFTLQMEKLIAEVRELGILHRNQAEAIGVLQDRVKTLEGENRNQAEAIGILQDENRILQDRVEAQEVTILEQAARIDTQRLELQLYQCQAQLLNSIISNLTYRPSRKW